MYIQKTTFSMKTIILARLKRLIQLTCAFVVLQGSRGTSFEKQMS